MRHLSDEAVDSHTMFAIATKIFGAYKIIYGTKKVETKFSE